MLEDSIVGSLLVDRFLSLEAMDDEEQIDNELFHEVDKTELENVFTRLSKDSMDSNLADSTVVSHVVSKFVNVFNDVKSESINDKAGQRIDSSDQSITDSIHSTLDSCEHFVSNRSIRLVVLVLQQSCWLLVGVQKILQVVAVAGLLFILENEVDFTIITEKTFVLPSLSSSSWPITWHRHLRLHFHLL